MNEIEVTIGYRVNNTIDWTDTFPKVYTKYVGGQTENGKPTVSINHSHTSGIGEKVDSAIALNLNVSLGIGHSGQFLDSVHSDYLSFFVVFIIAQAIAFVKGFVKKVFHQGAQGFA